MKAIQSDTITIVCDDCDFETDTNNMKEWLNKSCPKCGAKDLITEEDIKTYDALHLLMDTVNDVLGEENFFEAAAQNAEMSKLSVRITDGKLKEIEIDNEVIKQDGVDDE